MKTTPFTATHHALGAKMHEFAGYDMPIEYTSGIIDEHNTVVNGVGVFDVSHMGEFWVKGPKAQAFIQKMTTNDMANLPVGKAQYTCFPNDKGGVVDDLLVYHYEPEKYMLVVNASNIEKDWDWCVKNNTEGAVLENASDNTTQLAVQGPLAVKTLQKLTDVNLSAIPYYAFTTGRLAGIDNVILSNTGYTGCGGFELYFYPEYAGNIWKALFEAGAEFGIKPIGLGARDTLRLEAGFPLYGNEMDDTTSPLQAGLAWITKFVEGNNFISRPILEAEKAAGLPRKLVGFELVGKGIARHGYEIANAQGEIIGHVTSGTIIPGTKRAIGFGYVRPENAALGSAIFIRIREKDIEAVVVKPPFRRK
ncbi:MAG: Aminomethyltransferase [Candidatus Ordinivivax streblomastigis]|uniref:Aminomethyltransferase n=1 Tax=Candidatus Ordinivivax streblomastigis TaxID=2540710 RepID=A0A5M8P080_9BACT|nr:MAG: Aminomethyltransferase [Candidatus Ordinivivax streblomastigis]